MDARPKTRPVNRQRNTPTPQLPRGAKQIVIPMTQSLYDEIWHDTQCLRTFLAELWPFTVVVPLPSSVYDRSP